MRRRVGDALSVLKAIHLVEKEGSSYVWIGTKKNSSSSRQRNGYFTPSLAAGSESAENDRAVEEEGARNTHSEGLWC